VETRWAGRSGESTVPGLWHIVIHVGWDEDYFNEEVQRFIEFRANGTGHFQFGYVQGTWTGARHTGRAVRRRMDVGRGPMEPT